MPYSFEFETEKYEPSLYVICGCMYIEHIEEVLNKRMGRLMLWMIYFSLILIFEWLCSPFKENRFLENMSKVNLSAQTGGH